MRSLSLSSLCTSIATYVGVTCVTFALLHFLPGSPFSESERLASLMPLLPYQLPQTWDEWLLSLGHALCLDFGSSWRYPNHSAFGLILNAWPLSLALGLGALGVGWSLGIWGAVRSTLRGALTRGEQWSCTLALSLPGFLLAGLSLLCGLTTPRGALSWQLVVGALCLAPLPAAHLFLQLSPLLQREWSQPYCRAAFLRGVPAGRILRQHALRPALAQLATGLVPLTASLLTGTAPIERLLSIPGLGNWFVEGVLQRDVPVIQAVTMLFTLVLLSLSWGGQWLARLLDPRLRPWGAS